MGDSGGFVYQIDETYTTDDGNNMDCRHLTPIFDWNEPSKYKLWPGLSVVAKGSSMTIRYRTDNFDTSDTGWNDMTQALTSDYEQYNVWANKSSKRIQACFKDFTGEDFDLREYEIMNPLVEENR
jgi:hypothetical protein